MPPIPVHIDDPITPQKADGITPQTADQQQPPAQAQQAPQENVATTTTAIPSQAYPPARPGAAAVPAPTPYIPNPPPQPTRTTQSPQDGPPPPQPGAVPIPPSKQVAASTLPPPPKPGEAAKAREGGVTRLPPQMGVPAPGTNYAATHSTSTLHPPPTGATTVNLDPVTPAAPAPARPEGYVQNTNAQELSAAQRSSLEEMERRESLFGNVGLGGNLGGGGDRTGTGNMGGGGGEGVGVGETVGSAWSAVKSFVGTAGEKLAEAEEEAWRRINGK